MGEQESIDIQQDDVQEGAPFGFLSGRLERLKEKVIRDKTNIHKQWLEDKRQIEGKYSQALIDQLTEENKSRLFRNKTRTKCNTAIAHLTKMLFPNDTQNWSIKPIISNELLKKKKSLNDLKSLLESDNNPVYLTGNTNLQQLYDDLQEDINRIQAFQKNAADGMSRQISNDLTEAKYVQKCCEVIKHGVYYGTGILKAPSVVSAMRKAWLKNGPVYELDIIPDISVGIESVNPWNFFPDMSVNKIEDAGFVFERHYWSKRKLLEFGQTEGVNTDALHSLIKNQGTPYSNTDENFRELRQIEDRNPQVTSNLYEIWEYHGPLNGGDLLSAGCDIEDEELGIELNAIVWLGDGKVLKAVINPMETGETPYSVFNWEEDETSIFGSGIPYLLRHSQKAINAVWRMMYDSNGVAVMPQIIVDTSAVEPLNGTMELKGGKVWIKKRTQAPAGNVFKSEIIPSNQSLLANLYDLTEQAIDEEVNLPPLTQGDNREYNNQTARGMDILNSSAFANFKIPIKNFDGNVTYNVIKRFYDFHMQNNADQNIKGDFQIKIMESSTIIAREQHKQSYLSLLTLTEQSPDLKSTIDQKKLITGLLRSMHMLDVLSDDDEDDKTDQINQGSPQDNLLAGQLQLQAQQLQLRQQELNLKEQQMKQQFDLSVSKLAHQVNMDEQKLRQQLDLELLKIDNENMRTIQKVFANSAVDTAKLTHERNKTAVDAQLKVAEMNAKENSRRDRSALERDRLNAENRRTMADLAKSP